MVLLILNVTSTDTLAFTLRNFISNKIFNIQNIQSCICSHTKHEIYLTFALIFFFFFYIDTIKIYETFKKFVKFQTTDPELFLSYYFKEKYLTNQYKNHR